MNMKKFISEFGMTAVVVFVVTVVVTVLYNLIVHGVGVVDWEHAIRLAIIFGIALPFLHMRKK